MLTSDHILETLTPTLDETNRLSVEFDGRTQFHVDRTYHPNLNGISFAFFGQFRQVPKDQGDLLFKGDIGGTDYGIYLKGSHNTLRMFYSSNGTFNNPKVNTEPPIDDNKWHTVLLVFDRETETLYFYVDGQQAGTYSTAENEFTDDVTVRLFDTISETVK